MADAQRVVDGIRNFLHSGHQTALESLRTMAQEYSEACHEINRRLTRCEEFLRQGMRSEAIHFAQADPSLLDVLAILDFPERHEWDQVVAHYSLPAPPVFRMDIATALNQAYAQVAPLDELLKQHRLLALSRAPLGERLSLMRQIALVDAANPMWNQDIAAFEKVRLRQLRTEIEQLKPRLTKLPMSELEGLVQEVQGVPWRTPLPPELPAAIQEMYQAVRNSQMLERAEQLSRELLQAHDDNNEFQARMLAQEWQQVTQDLHLAPDGPVAQRASVALQWLVKLDRLQVKRKAHQELVDELQRALADANTPPDDLDAVYEELAASKGGVPGFLESAYRRRVREVVTARKRRERIILGILFILLASAFATLVFYMLVLRG